MTVIAGFPGVGKSSLAGALARDIESTEYKWSSAGVVSDEWPENYIKQIESADAYGLLALVSTHAEVRDALSRARIDWYLCYPSRECRSEYLQRYARRGSPAAFLDLLTGQWDAWIDEMESESRMIQALVLRPSEYLSDRVKLLSSGTAIDNVEVTR